MTTRQLICLCGVMLLVAVLLTACETQTDVWLYSDQNWKVVQSFEYDLDDLPSISADLEGIGIDVPLGGVADLGTQLAMGTLVPYYHMQGVEAGFNSKNLLNGEKKYILDLRGQGIEKLQDTGLGGEGLELLVDQLGTYASSNGVDPSVFGNLGVSVEALGGNQYHLYMASIPSFLQNTFRLHAGRIISSNANQVIFGTATWNNPTVVDVVFTPSAGIWNVLILVLIGVVILFGLGAGVVAIKSRMNSGNGIGIRPQRRVVPGIARKTIKNPHSR